MLRQCIDVVIPTYNRLWALPRVANFYLRCEEVRAVIVVDDASTDGTHEWLAGEVARGIRLATVRHEANRGASAARNTGARTAIAPFVFFADDDMVLMPADGLALMLREMRRQGADIAAPAHILHERAVGSGLPPMCDAGDRGAPRIYDPSTLELRSRRELALCALPMSFPTPLACGVMLMRREVLETVSYDEALGVTGYRDETDFQLKALREGFRLVGCSRPVLIDLTRGENGGGCRTSTTLARYEWKACVNNWRILSRHRDVIRERLGVRAPLAYLQARFVANRAINRLARHYVGRVLRRFGLLPKRA